jgi:outer membrane protein TolC
MAPVIAAAIIGAGASLASSGISAYSNYKSQQAQMEAREKAAKELKAQGQLTDNEYRQVINSIENYYNNRGSLGTQADATAYKQAIGNYNPSDYAYKPGEFTWDQSHTKEDYLNPYYGRIIGDTANQIQHTAAGAGLGRGTGAALNIAKGVSEKSDELYRTALQDYNTDRTFEYQKYADAIRNNQNYLDALRQGNEYKIGLQGNLAQDYYNTQDSRMSDVLKAQQDRLNAQQTYANAISGLY